MSDSSAQRFQSTPAPYFAFSDGFRALAIFGVFLGHLSSKGPSILHRVGLSAIVVPFDGVSMLFVLSGFLLSGPFIKTYLEASSDFPSVGSYALARVLRIYPLYLFAVAAISGFDFLTHVPVTTWDIASHVLFLQNISASTSQTVSGPLWTMAVDVQFYAALPILFWLLFRTTRRSTTRRKIVTLFVTLFGICIASVAYRYVAIHRFNPMTLEDGITVVRQLPGMLCVFAAGIAIRATIQTLGERSYIAVQKWAWGVIFVAIMLQALSLSLHLERLHDIAKSHSARGIFSSIAWSLEDLINGVACSLLLGAIALAPYNGVSRLLSTRLFAFCASISYAFYLFHLPVLQALDRPYSLPSWKLFVMTGSISLLILVPLCFALYQCIENPFLKLKSRLKRFDGAVVPDVSEMRSDRFRLES